MLRRLSITFVWMIFFCISFDGVV